MGSHTPLPPTSDLLEPQACLLTPQRIHLVSRNLTILGKRTSARLESPVWKALHLIAQREQCTIHELASLIYLRKKQRGSLSSALRIFIISYFFAATTDEGHIKANHGDFDKMLQRARIPRDFLRGCTLCPAA